MFEMPAGKKMRIEIAQLPPGELNPNFSRYKHWSYRAEARRIWRTAVFYSVIDARNRAQLGGTQFPFGKARLHWTFIYGVKRKRDADNLIAACKASQDALVDAGILLSDDTEHLLVEPPVILVAPERAPLTVIDIEEVVRCR